MPMIVCFYEDEKYKQFFPLTMLRPVYVLRAGIVPLFRRFERYFSDDNVCLVGRNQIAPLLAETYRAHPVNIIKRQQADVLFINGRIRSYGDLPQLAGRSTHSTVFTGDDEVAAVLFKSGSLNTIPEITTQKEYQELFRKESSDFLHLKTSATLYRYCWDVMADIDSEVTADFEHLKAMFPAPRNVKVHDGAFLVNQDNVFLGDGVEILSGAVIDASNGAVYIGDNVKLEPHASVVGPCYVGPNSIVLAGKVASSSIGHTCRVGGEVEESVLHSYVNKYHAGFIGHSYVGQWVNFGAMTTNSDLKNNYSSVRLTLNGEPIDSYSIKVGSFIGDHTKFGIGTLLNTGINIGVCCNIFGGTLVKDKEVPSFSWGNSEKYEKYELEKALETVKKTVERRDSLLSDHEAGLLETIYENSLTDDGIMNFSSG